MRRIYAVAVFAATGVAAYTCLAQRPEHLAFNAYRGARVGLIGGNVSLLVWWLASIWKPRLRSQHAPIWLFSVICVPCVGAAAALDMFHSLAPMLEVLPEGVVARGTLRVGAESSVAAAVGVAFYWLCVGLKRLLVRG